MKAFRTVILQGGDVSDMVVPVLTMTTLGVAFAVLAGGAFRLEESRAHYG
jgi:hypothetical protein